MKWGVDGDKWGKTGGMLWVNGGAGYVRLKPRLNYGWVWRIVDKTAVSVENYAELWIRSGLQDGRAVFYVDKFVDNGGKRPCKTW